MINLQTFKRLAMGVGLALWGAIGYFPISTAQGQSVVYQSSSPSSWAPLDSYYDRVTYRYYPNARVYYDPIHDLYYYYYNGRWYVSATLPDYLRRSLGTYILVDLDGDDPRYYDSVVTSRYPARTYTRTDVDMRTGQRTFTEIPLDQTDQVRTYTNLNTGERVYTQIPNDPNSKLHSSFNLNTGQQTYTQIPNDPNSTVRKSTNLRTGEQTYTQIPNNPYGTSSQFVVPGNNGANSFDTRTRQSAGNQQRARISGPVRKTTPVQRNIQLQQPQVRQQVVRTQPAQRNVQTRTAPQAVRQPVQMRVQQSPVQKTVTAPARSTNLQQKQVKVQPQQGTVAENKQQMQTR